MEAAASSASQDVFMRLRSKTGEIVEMTEKAVRCSGTLMDMLADLGIDNENRLMLDEPIDIAMSTEILQRVAAWCNENWNRELFESDGLSVRLMDKKVRLTANDRATCIFEDDEDGEKLMEMVMAADYFNIPNLLDVTTQFIASSIDNKNVDEIRDFFRLENDYLEEELDAVKKRYGWAGY